MSQYRWNDCPTINKEQILSLDVQIECCLHENLIGIYLHGSLAMGCFNPDRSDIDIIVVTKNQMTVDEKREMIEHLLKLSNHPCPIEISFIKKADLEVWKHPSPFELHYSEMWRDQNLEQLRNGEWEHWNEPKHQHRDPDLAAHFTIIRHRGITLYGEDIRTVFSDIPKEHYLDSIMGDFQDIEEITENPVYSILNMCRVHAYLIEGCICSKKEGGEWALKALPQAYHTPIRQALALYDGTSHNEEFDKSKLDEFSIYVKDHVYGLLK